MGLTSLMTHLKNRAAVPGVPPGKSGEGTREPAWIKAVPPVPSVPPNLNDTSKNMQIGQFGEAVNDAASADGDAPENLIKPQFAAVDTPANVELENLIKLGLQEIEWVNLVHFREQAACKSVFLAAGIPHHANRMRVAG